MRAALWTGGENVKNPSWAEKSSLCELVVAVDQGWNHLQTWGQKADFWIGDGDSLQGAVPPLECVFLPRNKDETDTEAGLRFVLQKGAKEVWLFAGAGRRMDHWLSNLYLLERFPQITRWFTAYEEVIILSPFADLKLEVNIFSLFPLGQGPWNLDAQGLCWPLNQVHFEEGYSLSNKTLQGHCHLKILQGRFMLLLPREEI